MMQTAMALCCLGCLAGEAPAQDDTSAATLDEARIAIRAASTPANIRQLTTTEYSECHLRWNPDGQRLSFAGGGKLGYVDANSGAITFLPVALKGDYYNSWSPDGQSIAFCASSKHGGYFVWTVPLEGNEPSQMTTHTGFMPYWTPDGSCIVYVSNVAGNMDIWKVSVESLEMTQLTANPASDWHPCCSPDGKHIAFSSDRNGSCDIWLMPFSGGQSKQITDNTGDEDFVCWSPDSKHIAYVCHEEQKWRLMIKSLITQKVGEILESDSIIGYLSWSPDGTKIAFIYGITGNKEIWTIDVNTSEGDKSGGGEGSHGSSLEGSYLGMVPPGNKPVLFAPGIVTLPDQVEFAISFTPDGKELFFTRRKAGTIDNRILHMQCVNGLWSEAAPAPFAADCFEFEPHVTPDGSCVLFGSKRPLPGQVDCRAKPLIWCAWKADNGWSQPEYWGAPFDDAMFVNMSEDRTIYNSGLSKSEPIDGVYGDWEDLAYHLYGYMHPCIAPDESYIIYDTESGIGKTSNGLFISFREPYGSWGPPKPLKAAFDVGARCWGASLSPDGKYLFFCAESDIYWVSSEVIGFVRDTEYFDPAYQLAKAIDDLGAERGVQVYDSLLSDRTGGTLASERSLNRYGYWSLKNGHRELSRDIFQLNTIRHPDSYNAYDSYAESLLGTGDTAMAVSNYKRSLELNPDNRNAAQVLETILGTGQ